MVEFNEISWTFSPDEVEFDEVTLSAGLEEYDVYLEYIYYSN